MLKLNKLTIAVLTLLTTSQSYAAGFQVAESSANGLGRAFAGEAAIGDNAASAGRNPALMSLMKKKELSVVASGVLPSVNIDAEKNELKANDVAPKQIVPGFYYVNPINKKIAVGLSVYSNYGTGTEYDKSYANGIDGGSTSLMTVNFNPSFSYKINKKLAIGAGISAVYTKAEMKRYVHLPNNTTIEAVNMNGDDISLGWNVGALYKIKEGHRIGISYKSKVKTGLKGDFKGIASLGQSVNGTMNVNLPSILEVSTYNKINKKFAISASYQKTTWSDFKDLVATSDNGTELLRKEEFYNDSNRYSVGLEYKMSKKLKLRTGYALDERAGTPTLSIPDAERQWFTVGGTYKMSKKISFDFGGAYVKGKDASFKESNINYKSKSDAYIVSGQVNYKF